MDVDLTPEQKERRSEILVAVDQAEASLARGEGRRVTSKEQAATLAFDVSRRGAERPKARHSDS